MIESIMYFGIGFLCAALLGLVIVPLVHNRAVRLTVRRVEAAAPVSIAEVQADKDQLRAEYAMATRRLELTIEQLKAEATAQLGELGRKTEAITILKQDLGERSETIRAVEGREKELQEQLTAREQELVEKTAAMEKTERALADTVAALARTTGELDELTLTADAQRVEITALRTQVDSLELQLQRRDKDIKDSRDRLAGERSTGETTSKALAEERSKVAALTDRVDQLIVQIAAQTSEAEAFARRAHDLEAQLSAERARLEQDAATTQRDAEAASASEQAENALLRERINDVAAEVARLTMTLEGPGSPIAAILASEPAASGGVNGAAGQDARANLADRIRALQDKASGLSPVS